MIREVEQLKPDRALRKIYGRGYEIYRSLYPTLQSTFPAMAESA